MIRIDWCGYVTFLADHNGVRLVLRFIPGPFHLQVGLFTVKQTKTVISKLKCPNLVHKYEDGPLTTEHLILGN